MQQDGAKAVLTGDVESKMLETKINRSVDAEEKMVL